MREVIVKSVLNKKKKRDSWFLDDYTLNPYEGCSFNCQYCYIRGSKYGENMADNLAVKINGPDVLAKQLAFRKKKNQYGIIALASATDPYIYHEKNYQVTRKYLEIIREFQFPVLIITKSDLILRDVDLLWDIDKHAIHADDMKSTATRGAILSFSFSSTDERITSALEPGAPSPQQRLHTMQKCNELGFHVGMNCIPTLPFISDSEEEMAKLVAAGKSHGAKYALIGGLTLFGNGPADSKVLYFKFLERKFPHLIPSYKNLYRIFYSPSKGYLDQLDRIAERVCKSMQMRRTIF